MKVPELLLSKKGQAFLIGLLTLVLKGLIGMDDKTAMEVVGLVSVYMFGQGISDHGKERAKVEAKSTETVMAAAGDKPA